MNNYLIASVSVAALIFGITEALKEAGVKGKASRGVVFGLGVLFVGISAANEQGLIAEQAMQWINLGVTAIAGGLAAMGYYDFAKTKTSKPKPLTLHGGNHATKRTQRT
jgi:hypothetical protein